jgi:hypothetical protein
MKKLLLSVGILMLAASPVLAGKNAQGALVLHTDDAYAWTEDVCDYADAWVPDHCAYFRTRTDKDENTPALIWLVAAFADNATPGVTLIYFGNDHNLPEYYHNHWGLCGPTGTLELPDSGWPDSPGTAGISIAFGSPIVGDTTFPFYYVNVWGFSGAYYCTGINPIGQYAAFLDDSSPPVLDECEQFGCVRWYEEGYNDPWFCFPTWGACCYVDGTCLVESYQLCMMNGGYDWQSFTECVPDPCLPPGACCMSDDRCLMLNEEDCLNISGEFVGEGILCEPDPCSPTSDVPEVYSETVTWGRIKGTYRD